MLQESESPPLWNEPTESSRKWYKIMLAKANWIINALLIMASLQMPPLSSWSACFCCSFHWSSKIQSSLCFMWFCGANKHRAACKSPDTMDTTANVSHREDTSCPLRAHFIPSLHSQLFTWGVNQILRDEAMAVQWPIKAAALVPH